MGPGDVTVLDQGELGGGQPEESREPSARSAPANPRTHNASAPTSGQAAPAARKSAATAATIRAMSNR